MCSGCWEIYGKPAIVTPAILRAAQLARECDEYGPLHILLEDWNIEDEHFPYLRSEMRSPAEIELIELMAPMTLEERASVLALEWGLVKQDANGNPVSLEA
jgi:hypothetical protein